MSDVMTEVIVDCSTGEQIIRTLTDEEVAQRKAEAEKFAAEQAAREAELAAKEAKKAEVLAALAAAAGLDSDEVAAVLS